MVHAGRHIPNKLRKYRRLMGYTQAQVALLLGVHCRSRIALWEQGIRMPSADNLLQLSILYCTLTNELYPDYLKFLKQRLSVKKQELKEIEDKNKK